TPCGRSAPGLSASGIATTRTPGMRLPAAFSLTTPWTAPLSAALGAAPHARIASPTKIAHSFTRIPASLWRPLRSRRSMVAGQAAAPGHEEPAVRTEREVRRVADPPLPQERAGGVVGVEGVAALSAAAVGEQVDVAALVADDAQGAAAAPAGVGDALERRRHRIEPRMPARAAHEDPVGRAGGEQVGVVVRDRPGARAGAGLVEHLAAGAARPEGQRPGLERAEQALVGVVLLAERRRPGDGAALAIDGDQRAG